MLITDKGMKKSEHSKVTQPRHWLKTLAKVRIEGKKGNLERLTLGVYCLWPRGLVEAILSRSVSAVIGIVVATQCIGKCLGPQNNPSNHQQWFD